jgi:hypothetical protein
VTQPVLHLDLIKLSPEARPEQRDHLMTAAAGLRDITGVTSIGVIEGEEGSDFDLAFWFLLEDFMALEPFGTDPRYSRFLQREVAPIVRGFAGADVTLDETLVPSAGTAACLAVIGPEEAYDFEVRDTLAGWVESTGAVATAIGLAVGEKQMYRGAALAFGVAEGAPRPAIEPFRGTLVRGESKVLA